MAQFKGERSREQPEVSRKTSRMMLMLLLDD